MRAISRKDISEVISVDRDGDFDTMIAAADHDVSSSVWGRELGYIL